jgi:hypothetical protein
VARASIPAFPGAVTVIPTVIVPVPVVVMVLEPLVKETGEAVTIEVPDVTIPALPVVRLIVKVP